MAITSGMGLLLATPLIVGTEGWCPTHPPSLVTLLWFKQMQLQGIDLHDMAYNRFQLVPQGTDLQEKI